MAFMPKTHDKALTHSARYRDFINGRDHVLEEILAKYLRATDGVMSWLLRNTQAIVSHQMVRVGSLPRSDQRLEAQIGQTFARAHDDLVYLFSRMRTSVYLLSHVAEAEAIGRATGITQKVHVPGQEIHRVMTGDTPSGGSVSARVDLALYRLKAKVMSALKVAQMLGETPKEAIDRIEKAFPKLKGSRPVGRTLRRAKPMKESAKDGPVSLVTGIFDQPTWDQMLQDYTEDSIPGPRGPHDKLVTWAVSDSGDVTFHERYEWELEQEITQDFVDQVRSGQVDAANQNGIHDFMWIAVTDKHTDECCLNRDGLSSAEIEARLKSGELNPDVSDATVPPAHFNCRCTPSPISDDLPAVDPPDYGSFDDWLESKRAA